MKDKYQTILERYEDCERIHEIGAAWLFTNTEKTTLGCNRLWAYDYALSLEADTRGEALTYGIAWHSVCEAILKQIQSIDTVMENRLAVELAENVATTSLYNDRSSMPTYLGEDMVHEWIQDNVHRIVKGIEGWIEHWRENVHPHYEIIAVEQVLCAPVVDPRTQGTYSPSIYVKRTEQGLAPIYPNELPKLSEDEKTVVNFPYWRVGKADVILRKRDTKALYILDHKTSASPASYAKRFSFDLQLGGYCALLEYEINHGSLQQYKGHKISGVIWDVCHSKIPDPPKPLKSGKLSTAKGRSVPSWQFEKAIEEHGLDRNDYKEYIEELKRTTDNGYFLIITSSIGANEMLRGRLEDFAYAEKMHSLRESLLICEDADFDYKAPRFGLCQQWSSCKWSSLCLPNTPLSSIVQKKNQKIYWRDLHNNTSRDNIKEEAQNIFDVGF